MNTIDEYIASCPKEIQPVLEKLRQTIKKAAPDAVECISWGMPTFKQNGNVVHFAAHKKHIGFYPGDTGIATFREELSEYKTSKGAVQFSFDKPVPLQLIVKIVKYRVKENQRLTEAKRRT